MSTMKANYGGGKKGGNLLEGLSRSNPPESDASRKPIGSKYPSVNTGAVRKDVGENPPTLGPRTA